MDPTPLPTDLDDALTLDRKQRRERWLVGLCWLVTAPLALALFLRLVAHDAKRHAAHTLASEADG